MRSCGRPLPPGKPHLRRDISLPGLCFLGVARTLRARESARKSSGRKVTSAGAFCAPAWPLPLGDLEHSLVFGLSTSTSPLTQSRSPFSHFFDSATRHVLDPCPRVWARLAPARVLRASGHLLVPSLLPSSFGLELDLHKGRDSSPSKLSNI